MTTPSSNRNLRGWRRQTTDLRDQRLQLMRADHTLPSHASIPVMPEVRDQGQLGSCTAHAGTSAASYLYLAQGKADPVFSPLALYAETRQLEGTPLTEDSGCQVRSVFKAMHRMGVPLEQEWPYDESKLSVDPPKVVDKEAMDHQAIKYLVCDNLNAIKHSIVDKFPAIGGFDCYDSMFTPAVDKTGDIPMPTQADSPQGGHCILFVAYDDALRKVMFLNSWTKNWGRHGFGFLPYGYFTAGLASDFWTLRSMEMPKP